MPINFTGSYNQNFNSLASSGTNNAWSNDSTLPGWFLFNQASSGTAITTYEAGTGSSTTGNFYSFGSSGSSDRALGGVGSGGAYFGSPTSGNVAGWIAFAATNTTGTTINKLSITFNGEQWRNSGNTTAQSMVLQYGFGSSFSSVSSWNTPGGNIDWTSPVATATAAAVNGNVAGLVANRGGTLTNLNWANNDTLWIRWIENNDAGNDHGLAIDDFLISASVNNAPVLSGNATFDPINEDILSNNNQGTTVANLISGLITDTNFDPKGIAVTSIDNTNGTWQYSTNSGTTWQDFSNTTANNNAVVLGATSLYSSYLGTAPASQNWLLYNTANLSAALPVATQTFGVGGTTLDSTADEDIYAGYTNFNFNSSATLVNANFPTLDNTLGYQISFNLQLLEESHTNSSLAGFSIIAISNDKTKAIELGFQKTSATTGNIFAQGDHNFNSAENVSFNTNQATQYTVAVKDNAYKLFANGVQILNGALRDYTPFVSASPLIPDVYEVPNLIFLGDDTTSAQGSFILRQVAVETETRIRFVPNSNYNGDATIEFHAWDTTNGLSNGATGVDASTNGGSTAFSTAASTVSITVNAVNDKPSFTATNPTAVNGGSGPVTVNNWATFNPGGGTDEASQTATYTVSNVSNSSLFSAAPSINTNGTLSYTPNAGTSGTSTFTVKVQDSGGTANDGIDISDEQTFTIAVNALPTVNLSVSASTGTEAGTTAITVTATASSAVSGNQTVTLGVAGTNITTDDYSLSNTIITIPSGNNTGSVTFTIVNDSVVETTEIATLTISNPSSGITLGSTTSQNITITDNDIAGVTISKLNTNITEGGANDNYTVVLKNQPTAPVTVNIIPNNNQINLGAGAANPISLNFTPNTWNTPQTVTVTAVNDSQVEGNHSSSISHTASSSDSNYTITNIGNVAVNITDNDTAGNNNTNTNNNSTPPTGTDNDPVEIDDCCGCDELEKQVNDTFKGQIFLPGIPPDDLMFGDVNPNFLVGGIGNDTIFGKEGEDLILGNQNKDIINGNEGKDIIFAGKDDDFVRGGKDNDLVFGDLGNDTICGDLGDDTVFGIIGDDILFGNKGDDILNGNQGKDTVCGGEGNDLVRGGKDNDLVAGGIGNDTVYGDMGDDTICGCEGNDLLIGGEGSDIFVLAAGRGSDIITNFVVGEDLLGLTNNLTFSNLKIIQGSENQAGDTFIYITATNELLASLISVDASLITANAIA